MAKDYQKNSSSDGQNHCRRCDRPLSDPTDAYGWRCAQIVGFDKYNAIADTLDDDALKLYNAYVETYRAEDDIEYDKLVDSNIVDDNLVSKVSFLQATDWRDASNIIARNSDAIKNAGAYYGVNPAIIAAYIYTEQITNVNVLDSLTDLPAYFADTSIGIGQVKVSTAKMLEDNGYIQKTEYVGDERVWAGIWSYYTEVWNAPAYGRVRGSREKAIAHRLTVESENVNYVAAYLAYWQDRWRDEYPEIDGRTAVLATLYNLGENADSPNPSPKPNPFGIQAKKEYHYMRQLLELE